MTARNPSSSSSTSLRSGDDGSIRTKHKHNNDDDVYYAASKLLHYMNPLSSSSSTTSTTNYNRKSDDHEMEDVAVGFVSNNVDENTSNDTTCGTSKSNNTTLGSPKEAMASRRTIRPPSPYRDNFLGEEQEFHLTETPLITPGAVCSLSTKFFQPQTAAMRTSSTFAAAAAVPGGSTPTTPDLSRSGSRGVAGRGHDGTDGTTSTNATGPPPFHPNVMGIMGHFQPPTPSVLSHHGSSHIENSSSSTQDRTIREMERIGLEPSILRSPSNLAKGLESLEERAKGSSSSSAAAAAAAAVVSSSNGDPYGSDEASGVPDCELSLIMKLTDLVFGQDITQRVIQLDQQQQQQYNQQQYPPSPYNIPGTTTAEENKTTTVPSFLMHLSHVVATPRRVCQHPFKRNDIVWVCRTCQSDETCVLCHACWTRSNHEGHDVAFYHAQAGGCCDCGDPDAWDPNGFCDVHGMTIPPASSQDDDDLKDSEQYRLIRHCKSVMNAIMDWLTDVVVAEAEESFIPAPEVWTITTTSSTASSTAAAAGGGSTAAATTSIAGTEASHQPLSSPRGSSTSSGRYGLEDLTMMDAEVIEDLNMKRISPSTTTARRTSTSRTTTTTSPKTFNSPPSLSKRAIEGVASDGGDTTYHSVLSTAVSTSTTFDDLPSSYSMGGGGTGSSSSSAVKMPSLSPPSTLVPPAADTSNTPPSDSKQQQSQDQGTMQDTFDSTTTSEPGAKRAAPLGGEDETVDMMMIDNDNNDDHPPSQQQPQTTTTATMSRPPHSLHTQQQPPQSQHQRRLLHSQRHHCPSLVQSSLLASQAATPKTRTLSKQTHLEYEATAHHLAQKGRTQGGFYLVLHCLQDIPWHNHHHHHSSYDWMMQQHAHLYRDPSTAALGNVLSGVGGSGTAAATVIPVAHTVTLYQQTMLLCRHYGDLALLGTSDVIAGVGMETSTCWRDGDTCKTTLVGKWMLEQVSKLQSNGGQWNCSIKTHLQLLREQRATAIISWLSVLARSSDILCQTMAETIRGTRHLIPLLRVDLKLPRHLTKKWHALLLTLLAVPRFKMELAQAYCDTYAKVTHDYARGIGVSDASSFTLSVQFLNRQTYVRELAARRQLLNRLTNALYFILRSAQIRPVRKMLACPSTSSSSNTSASASLVPSYEVVLDPSAPVLSQRRYAPCISDIKCVLNVEGMPRLFATKCLGTWITILMSSQGMDKQTWRPWNEGHVESEPRGWVGAFNCSISLGSLFERILTWDEEDFTTDNMTPSSTSSSNMEQVSLRTCKDVTHIVMNGISKWQTEEVLHYQSRNSSLALTMNHDKSASSHPHRSHHSSSSGGSSGIFFLDDSMLSRHHLDDNDEDERGGEGDDEDDEGEIVDDTNIVNSDGDMEELVSTAETLDDLLNASAFLYATAPAPSTTTAGTSSAVPKSSSSSSSSSPLQVHERCPAALPYSTVHTFRGTALAQPALPMSQVEPWSFHYPLHRFLSICLRELARRGDPSSSYEDDCDNDNDNDNHQSRTKKGLQLGLESWLDECRTEYYNDDLTSTDTNGNDEDEWRWRRLLEFPLSVLSRTAQIRAEMWKRNGSIMMDQVLNYAEPPFCRSLRDADLSLLQFSMVALNRIVEAKTQASSSPTALLGGTSYIINVMVHRYGVFDFCGLAKGPNRDVTRYANEIQLGLYSAELPRTSSALRQQKQQEQQAAAAAAASSSFVWASSNPSGGRSFSFQHYYQTPQDIPAGGRSLSFRHYPSSQLGTTPPFTNDNHSGNNEEGDASEPPISTSNRTLMSSQQPPQQPQEPSPAPPIFTLPSTAYFPPVDPKTHLSLFEELLHLLIMLVTELPSPPSSSSSSSSSQKGTSPNGSGNNSTPLDITQAKQRLRREVIHRLVSGAKTHSELCEVHHVLSQRDNTALSEEGRKFNPNDASGALLEITLKEVAMQRRPTRRGGLDPDQWVLRKELWEEYDPAFFHIPSKSHEAAAEFRPKATTPKSFLSNYSPRPYCPRPSKAHPMLRRIRRDVTSDGVVIAMLYRVLHAHLSNTVPEGGIDEMVPTRYPSSVRGKSMYDKSALNETVLARAVHLLTLGAFAWEEKAKVPTSSSKKQTTPSLSWMSYGGGGVGSVFHGYDAEKNNAKQSSRYDGPEAKEWITAVLLESPSKLLQNEWYRDEECLLILLQRLASSGTGRQSCFVAQDSSLRSGAAWLCDYAMRYHKQGTLQALNMTDPSLVVESSSLLSASASANGPLSSSTTSQTTMFGSTAVGTIATAAAAAAESNEGGVDGETDLKRRQREAKERAMKRIAQMQQAACKKFLPPDWEADGCENDSTTSSQNNNAPADGDSVSSSNVSTTKVAAAAMSTSQESSASFTKSPPRRGSSFLSDTTMSATDPDERDGGTTNDDTDDKGMIQDDTNVSGGAAAAGDDHNECNSVDMALSSSSLNNRNNHHHPSSPTRRTMRRPRYLLQERPTCIHCHDDSTYTNTESMMMSDTKVGGTNKTNGTGALAFCALAQSSTVLKGGGGPTTKNIPSTNNNRFVGVHVRLCGHAIHTSCCDEYLASSLSRDGDSSSSSSGSDRKRGEFRCPMCQRLSNCLVPFIDVEVSWIDTDDNDNEHENEQQHHHVRKDTGDTTNTNNNVFDLSDDDNDGTAMINDDEEKQNSMVPCVNKRRSATLDDFLSPNNLYSQWFLDNSGWDGRCTFEMIVPPDEDAPMTTDLPMMTDGDKQADDHHGGGSSNAISTRRSSLIKRSSFKLKRNLRSLGKKDLFSAWSMIMRSPSHRRKSSSSGTAASTRDAAAAAAASPLSSPRRRSSSRGSNNSSNNNNTTPNTNHPFSLSPRRSQSAGASSTLTGGSSSSISIGRSQQQLPLDAYLVDSTTTDDFFTGGDVNTNKGGATHVWKRFMDQITEVGSKADFKRLGGDKGLVVAAASQSSTTTTTSSLTTDEAGFGEFRHNLTEELVYNYKNLEHLTDYRRQEWPLCLFGNTRNAALDSSKSYEFEREKLISQLLYSIQSLTYSCCAEAAEVRRLSYINHKAATSSSTHNADLSSKYGLREVSCRGKLIVMPPPNVVDEGGERIFEGRLGRLRFYSLAVIAASGVVSRELVQMCFQFPIHSGGEYGEEDLPPTSTTPPPSCAAAGGAVGGNNTPYSVDRDERDEQRGIMSTTNLQNDDDDENDLPRSPMVYPLLRGHILTHTVAAMCGICGRKRILNILSSTYYGGGEEGTTPKDSTTMNHSNSSSSTTIPVVSQCFNFIKLGYVARCLQVLFGRLKLQTKEDKNDVPSNNFKKSDSCLSSSSNTLNEKELLNIAIRYKAQHDTHKRTASSGNNDDATATGTIQWNVSCATLIIAALGHDNGQTNTTLAPAQPQSNNQFDNFCEACAMANVEGESFLADAALILQILVPGVSGKYAVRRQMSSLEESGSGDELASCLGVESLETMLQSDRLKNLVSHWYKCATQRSQRHYPQKEDESRLGEIQSLLSLCPTWHSSDWPVCGLNIRDVCHVTVEENTMDIFSKSSNDIDDGQGPSSFAFSSTPPTGSDWLLFKDRFGQRSSDSPSRSKSIGSPMDMSPSRFGPNVAPNLIPQKSVPFMGVLSNNVNLEFVVSPSSSSSSGRDSFQRLPSLPVSYTDLYAQLGALIPESDQTAVCLICGAVLNAAGKGQCTKHAVKCGSGCGLFFLLQECVGLILHGKKAAYVHSPYVDSHGETPQYRGRPLNLDLGRYEILYEMWAGHSIREKVMSERANSRQVIIANFY